MVSFSFLVAPALHVIRYIRLCMSVCILCMYVVYVCCTELLNRCVCMVVWNTIFVSIQFIVSATIPNIFCLKLIHWLVIYIRLCMMIDDDK